jgi:hypothetical protein
MSMKDRTLIRVLKSNLKPILHMRKQFRDERLGLVLGSGTSKPLGIPTWDSFLDEIAKRTSGTKIIKRAVSATTKAEQEASTTQETGVQ